MSKIYQIGSTWKGFQSIGRLIIFGDSYSSVEFVNHEATKSSPAEPLGSVYPGNGTWNEPDEPNWVGHLITKYRPGPKYAPNPKLGKPGQLSDQDKSWIDKPLLVHDYARGGDTVHGVQGQVETQFLPKLGKNQEVTWTSKETLFVTWVGINDCSTLMTQDDIMADLFKLQDQLYRAGGRNFLFIDLPPIHRTPAVPGYREAQTAANIKKWNEDLRQAIELFVSAHEDVSAFLYSSFALFNSLLDDPTTFGFKSADIKRRGGGFWVDHVHPSSLVHDHIANDMAHFLTDILPAAAGP